MWIINSSLCFLPIFVGHQYEVLHWRWIYITLLAFGFRNLTKSNSRQINYILLHLNQTAHYFFYKKVYNWVSIILQRLVVYQNMHNEAVKQPNIIGKAPKIGDNESCEIYLRTQNFNVYGKRYVQTN